MGGFGSGRYEYARTPTVEECRHLDADEFADLVDAPPGAYADLRWNGDNSIRAYLETDDTDEPADALRLVYTSAPGTDAERRHEYRIPFDYTEPHFGGVRPWFRCPRCRDRRRKVYLPPARERFACRECYELGYQSSRSSGNELKRAEQRYRKAFARADKDSRHRHPEGMDPILPEKPKGMHEETFEDLMQDVDDAHEEWYAEFRRRQQELLARLE